MQSMYRNIIMIPLLSSFLMGLPEIAFSERDYHNLQSRGSSTLSGPSPLIEEMTTHDSAYANIVTAVALGDREQMHKAIASMRVTMQKTVEGVRSGTVTLPKNTPRVKEFIEMERKFHDKLDALDRAAHHNNQREMQRITNQLLSACVQCHQTFRK
jgi:cytochrome c556